MARSFEDELELMTHVRRLWTSGWIILGAVVLGAVVGGLVEGLRPHMYRGTATLRVIDPQVLDRETRSVVTEMIPLFTTNRVVNRVVDEFDLAEAPWDLPPNDFRRYLHVNRVPGTNFITVSVDLEDAELAREVANRLAQVTVDLHEELVSLQIERNRDFLGPQIASVQRRMGVDKENDGEGGGSPPSRPSGADNGDLAAPLQEFVELYRRQVDPTEDEIRRDAAAELYGELLTLSEMAEVSIVSRNARMEVVDPASHAWPFAHTLLTAILLGGTLGFMVAVVGVLIGGIAESSRATAGD